MRRCTRRAAFSAAETAPRHNVPSGRARRSRASDNTRGCDACRGSARRLRGRTRGLAHARSSLLPSRSFLALLEWASPFEPGQHQYRPCQGTLRQNAVEKGDILLRLEKARDALVLGAMLLCNAGRPFEVAAEADLSRIRIALEQKRLLAGAGSGKAAGHENENDLPRCNPPQPTPRWWRPPLTSRRRRVDASYSEQEWRPLSAGRRRPAFAAKSCPRST